MNKKLLVCIIMAIVLVMVMYKIRIQLFEDLSVIIRMGPRFW